LPPRLTICSSVFHIDELFEAFGLDQFLQDCLLAHLGELDGLVRTFDTLLDPGFFFRIGNVHELDTERRAIGTRQDVDHLAHGGVFEPQHLVDEDFPVHVGFGEAVCGRRQFIVVFDLGGNAERIKIGMQMPAHTEGADHHDRTNRILRRTVEVFSGRGRLALCRSLGLQSVNDNRFGRPIAVQRRNQIAIGLHRPVRLLP
jgi:hypothetical protein